jgi:energy-coupling factor transporter ATP-binding protein EcfA2
VDEFTDRQIADALEIDVLGHREDRDRTVEVYSKHFRRTITIRDHSRLRYADALQLFGTPARKAITVAEEDVPDMYSLSDVRNMLGHLSGPRVIGDETKRGFGVWPNGTDDGLIMVNLGEALHVSPAGLERIEHPRYGDMLLDFSSGTKPWYDHDALTGALEDAQSREWRAAVADDLLELFGRWRWGTDQDPIIMTALVFATWVQTLWPWRPRIDVLGASGSGKTILCEALMGIFRDHTISTYDTTAAGLRQQMRKSSRVVIVDEIDCKSRKDAVKQREILKMLRSASRSSGAVAIRGTPSGEASEFSLHHLCWLAGISLPYEDQADRNRAIITHLLPATREKQNQLRLPSPAELGALGQRSLAAAVCVAPVARLRATSLKDVPVDGADPRQVESYAVPAAMLSAVMGYDDTQAASMLRQITLEAIATDDEAVEPDEVVLVKTILGATIQLGQHRMTAGQVLDHIAEATQTNREEWMSALNGAGIRIDGGEHQTITLAFQLVQAKLLRGTRWEGQQISQYLRRVDGAEPCRNRVGGINARGVRFNLASFKQQFSAGDLPIPYGQGF